LRSSGTEPISHCRIDLGSEAGHNSSMRPLACGYLCAAWALAIEAFGCGGDSGHGSPADASDEGFMVITLDSGRRDGASSEASTGRDAGPYPAPHAPAPQVITYGGPILPAPRVVPIFFANDPLQGPIEQSLVALVGSAYWTAATSEYGVGPLTVAPSIVVSDPLPTMISDAEIAAWLAGYLDGTHPSWPRIEMNNIYMVFYQSGTTITLPMGGAPGVSCKDFGGYHAEGAEGPPADGGTLDASTLDAGPDIGPPDGSVDGGTEGGDDRDGSSEGDASDAGSDAATSTPFVYSVLPRCQTFDGFTGIDMVSATISHELAEAATDPLVSTNPAYATADQDHVVWDFTPYPELGDMCAFEPQSFQRLAGNFIVQRIWSNRSAASGGDPCSPPLVGSVYFNAVPDLGENVTLSYGGQGFQTLGVKIPVGQSKTIAVRLFSTAPTADWTLQFADTSSVRGGPRLLDFNPTYFNGNNGDVAQVSITAVAAGPLGGAELIVISARDNVTTQYWFGFVQN
jgi:hypothetical protein